MTMKKAEAAKLFGSQKAMAHTLGLAPRTVYMWGNDLDQSQVDRIIGAAIRLGIPLPGEYLEKARAMQVKPLT